jgi:hypothetical protein
MIGLVFMIHAYLVGFGFRSEFGIPFYRAAANR